MYCMHSKCYVQQNHYEIQFISSATSDNQSKREIPTFIKSYNIILLDCTQVTALYSIPPLAVLVLQHVLVLHHSQMGFAYIHLL